MATNPLPKLFQTFRQEAFRLETRRSYRIEANGEYEQFQRYLEGAPLPDLQINRDWYSDLRKWRSAHKDVVRVRLLPNEAEPYIWFEIDWYYSHNALNGEQLYFMLEHEFRNAYELPIHDYWMFDRASVGTILYSEDGSFVNGGQPIAPLDQYVKVRETIFNSAVPFKDILKRSRSRMTPFSELF